jgi:hypothetical protein
MFSERRKQQRPIILNPKVAFAFNELLDPVLAICKDIGWFEVVSAKPDLVATSSRRPSRRSFPVNTQE